MESVWTDPAGESDSAAEPAATRSPSEDPGPVAYRGDGCRFRVGASQPRGFTTRLPLRPSHLVAPAPTPLIQEAADGVIRLLGARRRLSTHGAASQPEPTRLYSSILGGCCSAAWLCTRHIDGRRSDVPERSQCTNPACSYSSEPVCRRGLEHTTLSAASVRRVHLHAAGGVCTDCQIPLGSGQPLAAGHGPSDNYYSYLATQAGPLFRLNCEELTGQTNKSDGRKRQRLFQDICLPPPDEIRDH